jgi:hypothetical protein
MKGTSYTYFTTDNSKSARELISILREAKADVPQQLEEMAMYSGGGGGRSKSLTCPCVSCVDLAVQIVIVAGVVVVEVAVAEDTVAAVGEVDTANMVVPEIGGRLDDFLVRTHRYLLLIMILLPSLRQTR